MAEAVMKFDLTELSRSRRTSCFPCSGHGRKITISSGTLDLVQEVLLSEVLLQEQADALIDTQRVIAST